MLVCLTKPCMSDVVSSGDGVKTVLLGDKQSKVNRHRLGAIEHNWSPQYGVKGGL